MKQQKQLYQCPVKDQLKQLLNQNTPTTKREEMNQFIQLVRTDDEFKNEVVTLLCSLLADIDKKQSAESQINTFVKFLLKFILGIAISIIILTAIALILLHPPFSISLLAFYFWLLMLFVIFLLFLSQVENLSKSDSYNMFMFVVTLFSLAITLWPLIKSTYT